MTGERPVIGQSRPVVNYLVVNYLGESSRNVILDRPKPDG
jgi:hypothetical protein